MELDEFTLDRWEKCLKGDLKWVNRDNLSTELDGVVWVKLYNNYLGRFGIDDGLDAYLDCKIQLTKLRCAFIESGDEFLLNQIAIEEINLKNLDPSKSEGMTLDECLVHLSKWMGQMLRKNQITIVEFRSLMNEYTKSNKE